MELHTARLRLRELDFDDLDALLEMYGDAHFQRFEGHPQSRETVQLRLNEVVGWASIQPRTRFVFGLTLPPNDTARGILSLSLNNASIHEWEIGWGIHPSLWGQGLAVEGARAMLGLAFNELDANRVVAFCHAGNLPSERVMQKLGMQREGLLRETRWLNGQRYNEYVYAILRSDDIGEDLPRYRRIP